MPQIFAAVVAVAGSISGGATVASAIAAATTYALKTVLMAGVSRLATDLLAPKQKQAARQASITTLSLGEQPREAIFGRAQTGGTLLWAWNYGGKHGTDNEVVVLAVADHLCDALEGFWVDDEYYAFASDGPQPDFYLNGQPKLHVYWRNGSASQTFPASLAAGGDFSNDDLKGVAYVVFDYKYNANGKVFSGRPSFKMLVRGKRLYDPRKDTTVGGSGSHRWADASTWEWGENAYLCRYNWARGIYALDQVDQPEHLLIGRGLSATEAPPSRAFAPANLCDEDASLKAWGSEKRYRVGGVVRADEAFIDVEEMFAAAMAGEIIQPEGSIDIAPGAAQASVATITDADLVIGEPVQWSDFEPGPVRINSIIPTYVEPTQNWQTHAAPVRRSVLDIQADGGPHEEPLDLSLVTSGTQAQRCGEIRRRRVRRERTRTITLPPWYSHLEEGDWISWTSDRYDQGQTRIWQIKRHVLGAGRRITLSLAEIAATDFAWTAALDEATPGAPPPTEATPPSPLSLDTVTAVPISVAGVPGIRFTWDTPTDEAVTTIRAEVRVAGAAEAAPTVTQDVQAGVLDVTAGVGGAAAMEARLVPQGDLERASTPSAWIAVTTSGLAAGSAASVPWSGVTNDGNRPADNATVGARAGTNLFRTDGSTVLTQAEVRTAEGVAASISGQGALATSNTALWGSQISGRPANVAALAGTESINNNRLSGNVLNIQRPEGAVFNNSTSVPTGAIRIDLPQGWTSTMLSFRLRVFNYSVDTWTEYQIAGYTFGAGSVWANCSARMMGPRGRARPVRFGYDSSTSKCVIWIGDPTDVWNYPKVEVLDFQAGHSNYAESQWASGWSISLDTAAATNVSASVLVPRATDSVFGEGIFESSAGTTATLPNFKTSSGTAAAIAGQGALATASAAAWGSQITGRPTELIDGRVSAGLDASGDLVRNLTTTRANASNLLRYSAGGLFTGELAADVTNTHTAAAIAGQGALATLSTVAMDSQVTDGTTYKRYAATEQTKLAGVATGATVGARSGTNLFRTDGSTVMTQAEVRTAEGVASAITGQGALATMSTVGGNSLVALDATSLFPDPDFVDPASWVLSPSISIVTNADANVAALPAVRGLKFSATGITGQFQAARYKVNGSSSRPCEPGATYRLTFDARAVAGFNGQLFFQGNIARQDGSITSFAGVTVVNCVATPLAVTTDYLIDVFIVAPADAVRWDPQLYVNWDTTWATRGNVGDAYVGNLRLMRAITPTMAVDKAFRLNKHIAREDGTTHLTDALAVTSLGTASAIAGQGALATASAAAWSSQITGRPTELTDGRISAGLDASGDLVRNLTTTRANASNLLRYSAGGLFTGELAADVTSTHTASAIAGQGALATASAAAWGSQITGRPTELTDGRVSAGLDASGDLARDIPTARANSSALLRFTGGGLFTGELAADVTSTHTASAIAGQGALATASSAAWSTQITGRPTELTDGRVSAGLDASGDLVRNLTTTRANASNLLRYSAGGLFTGELAADVTSTHTASAIAGQGALATLSTVALDSQVTDGTTYKRYAATEQTKLAGVATGATVGARAGTNLFRTDGTTVLSQAEVRTAEGVAASISGQTAAATAPDAQVFNNRLENSIVRVAQPVGGTLSNQTVGVAGAIRIKLPLATGGSNSMIRFRVDIYEYATDKMQTYEVGGYTYNPSSSWINFAARMVGGSGAARAVRFGISGGYWTVWIGEAAGTWEYPAVTVRDVQVSYSNLTVGAWETGWALAFDTSAATSVTGTVTTPVAGDAVFGLNARESVGGTIASLANFKTSSGTAAAIAGQGALATASSAAWGSQITGRPTELTDGRIAAGLDSSGDLVRNLTSARANASNLLRYTAGGLFTGELAADVTSTHTASAIAGQGALATLSSVALDSQVTDGTTYKRYAATEQTKLASVEAGATAGAAWGTNLTGRPTELTDGRIAAGLDSSGDLVRNLTSARANGSNLLRYTAGGLFTGELAADVTSTHTASAIAGQGALATLSSVALDSQVTDGSTYKRYAATEQTKLAGVATGATVGARSGTNLFRTDGSTVMTQAEVRTVEGVAASISGQGALATLGSIDTAQITTGATTRLSFDQTVGTGANCVNRAGSADPSKRTLIKSYNFTVDTTGKLTIFFLSQIELKSGNRLYFYLKVTSVASPTWGSDNVMTNADLDWELGGSNGDRLPSVAKKVFASGLTPGSHTVEVWWNDGGSGSHNHDPNDPLFEITEVKKAA